MSVPSELNDPGPVAPDTSDWTWVLTRRCPDCGFDPKEISPLAFTEIVRDDKQRYAAVLRRAGVRGRPSAGVWSPLEYCCHVRDVCDVMRERLEQILAARGGAPVRFANWDQDAAAVDGAYWQSDPETVRYELEAAFEAAAEAFDRPDGDQWSWTGLRGDGAEFTARTLGLYFIHDLTHHLWDVQG